MTIKHLAIPVFLTLCIPLFAQTLLVNGGHEDFIPFPSVPDPTNTCWRELYYKDVILPPLNPPNPPGIAAATPTPDHLCESPHSGKAHGGAFLFPKSEHPIYHLCTSLLAGEQYQFSFWLKCSATSNTYADRFSVWFTNWDFKNTVPGPIQQTPAFRTPAGQFLKNLDYQQFQFTYTAKGGEDAIVLGNFADASAPKGSDFQFNQPGSPSNFSYYHYDDLELKPVPRLTGPDSICFGGILQMQVANAISCSPLDIHWYKNSLNGPVEWTGDTYSTSVYDDQTWIVLAGKDTLIKKITVLPVAINLIKEDSLFQCESESISIQIESPQPGVKYAWSNGINATSIQVLTPGIYSVIATNGLCQMQDTVWVIQKQAQPLLGIPDTISLCPGVSFIVELPELLTGSYFINNLPFNTGFTIDQPGTYEISVTPPCLFIPKKLIAVIDGKSIPAELPMPNIFTPNQNNQNDKFQIAKSLSLINYACSVYNRWGAKVFATTSQEKDDGWDGTIEGKPAPMDIYVWVVEIEYENCGKSVKTKYRGEVSLVR